MATLYLVATPIGNLEDITLRALRILREAPLIAAEDTRQTRKLLQRYDIHTPLTSYHEHNKARKTAELLQRLSQGDLALVSDAGTPAINDPGWELVQAAIAAGHTITPVPGPSAPLAALIASGLPTEAFVYLGYLPRKRAARRARLSAAAPLPYTLIFLETPHRLRAALSDLHTILGNRRIALGRELTKVHEEIWRGTLAAACAHFAETAPRGEFTLIVEGAPPPQEERWPPERLRAEIERARGQGEPPARLAQRLAALSGWPRREIYRQAVEAAPQTPRPTGQSAHS